MSAPTEVLDFVLPGEWWRIPLDLGEAATTDSIRGLVQTVVGRSDELASRRAELREQLAATTAAAKKVQAHQLYLATRIVGSLPFPVSLVVAWPDLPVSVLGSPVERAELVAASLPEGSQSQELDVVDLSGVAAARTASVRSAVYEVEGESLTLPHLDVNYWVTVEGVERVALLSFTSPMVELTAELIELFDAVISTISVRNPVA